RRGAGNPRRDRPRLCARLPDPGGDGRRNGFRPMGLTCSGNGKEHHVYHGVRVLDVHGHVSVPFSANSFLILMMGSNTPMASPIGQDRAGPAAVSVAEFRAAARGHVTYMDDRNIDVQIIGPRPFLMMGWMEEHL